MITEAFAIFVLLLTSVYFFRLKMYVFSGGKFGNTWYGSLFILLLGFLVYLNVWSVVETFVYLISFQTVGFFVYYYYFCDWVVSKTFMFWTIAFNLFLVLVGSFLPAVCAWVFDLTKFETTSALYIVLVCISYFLCVIVLQSPLYYLFFVPVFAFFFIFYGTHLFDEAKTTVFFFVVIIYHYLLVLCAEYGMRNIYWPFLLYAFVWAVVLLLYGLIVSNNHHDFYFYLG